MNYLVISPDGIPTTPFPLPTLPAAFEEVARFCKVYVDQGFYSAVYGRIPLVDLIEYLKIEEYTDDENEETPEAP